MDRDKMSNLYKGPFIDASYQVSVHLAEDFQRRRLKCEYLHVMYSINMLHYISIRVNF
jgi:hypothetical protein